MSTASKARNLARNEYIRIRRAYRDAADRRALGTHGTRSGHASVIVHFADIDPDLSLYQLRQWYEPLLELNSTIPVVITVRRASVARVVAQECALPVEYLRSLHDLERYMEAADPRVVFYVNQSANNFQVMRYGRAMHVFISHGESEKVYMSSGQIRAYDFAFIAGQAAFDRILAAIPNYDPGTRTRQIGRPQLDFLPPDRSGQGDVRTVFYAPTCEGDRPSMAYGSIESHGLEIVQSLVEAGYRVIYRPHPLSGSQSEAYRRADRAVRDCLLQANAQSPPGAGGHVIDTAGRIADQIADSDVAIVDISAMAFDWLVTGKPLVVTIPTTGSVVGVHNSFLSACYRLPADEASRAADLVSQALRDDTLREQRSFWIARHFGDTRKGESTRRFIEATREIVSIGEHQVRLTEQRAAELSARVFTGPPAAGDESQSE